MTKSTCQKRPRRPRVSEEELALFRADPAREEKLGIEDHVVCRECGSRQTCLGTAHLLGHGLSAKEYGLKWPGAPLYSPYQKAKRKKNQQNWVSRQDASVLASYKRADYHAHKAERIAAAIKWNKENPGEHKKAYEKYRQKPESKAKEKQRKLKHQAKIKAALEQAERNWRPQDWFQKPTEWRIIGDQLLSNSCMSNKELAERLDGSRIVICPYGRTWRSAIEDEHKGCTEFIRRIRGWIRRPGKVKAKPAAG